MTDAGPSDPHFRKLPKSLDDKSKTMRLGDNIPALLAHPDWETPSPAVVWMHGRTVYKELDPGRYLRWLRAGIATISLDLPGHGERYDQAFQSPHKTLDTLDQMALEIDAALEDACSKMPIDMEAVAIGGMSAGGMAALIRLSKPHRFAAAAVESATGNLQALYFPDETSKDAGRPWPAKHDPQDVAALDPIQNLGQFSPVPLLAIHTKADKIVPWPGQKTFLDTLKAHYRDNGNNPELIEVTTFDETGAIDEHAGFGRFAGEAKDTQTDFLVRTLKD